MNLLEELRNLDPRDARPLAGRVSLRASSASFSWWSRCLRPTTSCGRTSGPSCCVHSRKSRSCDQTFEQKQRKAANLEAYKEQLKDMERSFGAMLRQLPARPKCRACWSIFRRPAWPRACRRSCSSRQGEVRRDFYAELPIKIRLTGSYHQLGNFVSGIAALPRIVTLHDIEIKPESKDSLDQLVLDVTAKTYRYLEEDEDKGDAAKAAQRGGQEDMSTAALGDAREPYA